MWFGGPEECWGHMLHELCTPAALHDHTHQRGELGGGCPSGYVSIGMFPISDYSQLRDRRGRWRNVRNKRFFFC